MAVSPNAFVGKWERPNNDELAAVWGPPKALWDELASDLARENQIDVQERNSHSPKAGWSLRLKPRAADYRLYEATPSRPWQNYR